MLVSQSRKRQRSVQRVLRWVRRTFGDTTSLPAPRQRARLPIHEVEWLERRLLLSGDPVVSIAASDPFGDENGGAAVLTVDRTGPTDTALTVNYSLAGAAVNGTDYNLLDGSIDIPIGSSQAGIIITPVDDALLEGDETVTVTLLTDAAYTVAAGPDDTAAATVYDNDNTVPVANNDTFNLTHDTSLVITDALVGVVSNDAPGEGSLPGAGGGGYEVTGAGAAGANQAYEESGTYNNKPYYRGATDDSYYIEFDNTWGWIITTWHSPPPMPPFNHLYHNSGGDDTPPQTGWTLNTGAGPAPTVSESAPENLVIASLAANVTNGSLTFNDDGTFSYTPAAGFAGVDTFTYSINDGYTDSVVATVTLNVTNTAPVADAGSYDVAMNIPLVITDAAEGVLDADTDSDGDALTAVLVDDVQHGVLDLSSDGTFTYTPNTEYVGLDTFTYRADDGIDHSAVTTVTLDVQDLAPQAVNDSHNLLHDTVLTISDAGLGLLGNDDLGQGVMPGTAVNGFEVAGAGTGGANQVYEEAGSLNGKPYYRGVTDDGYYIEYSSMMGWWIITTLHNPPPFPPLFELYNISDTGDTPPLTGWNIGQDGQGPAPSLAALSSGPELTISVIDDVDHGALTVNADGTFTYTPDAAYVGSDTLTYKINDTFFDSNVATVTFDVTNSAPVAVNDSYDVDINTALDITDVNQGVMGNDTDADGEALTAVLTAAPAHGTVTLSQDGTFTYTPNNGYAGPDSFAYQLSDGAATSNATVNLAVQAPPPIAVDDAYNTNHDTALVVGAVAAGVIGNDDPGQGVLPGTTAADLELTGAGTSSVNQSYDQIGTHNGKPKYQGLTDASFYIEWNGAGWTITQNPGGPAGPPMPPYFHHYEHSDDTATPPATGWAISTMGLPGAPTVAPGATGDPVTISLVDDAQHGTLTLAADGSFTYSPDALYVGVDTFTYDINDGYTNSNVATVTINVNNTAPTGVADNYTVGANNVLSVTVGGVLANDSDGEGDSFTAALDAAPTHGALTLNSDGTFDYTPDVDYEGLDSFTYRADDSFDQSDPVAVTINVTNDAPQAVDDNYNLPHDNGLTISDVSLGLLDNDDLGQGVTPGSAASGFEVTGAGTAAANQVYEEAGTHNSKPYYRGATDDAYYMEYDNTWGWIITTSHNPPPMPPFFHLYQNSGGGDTPPETGWSMNSGSGPAPTVAESSAGPEVTITVVDDVDHGSLTVNADGTFTYTPDALYVGADTFAYKINDTFVDSNIATVTFNVTNAAPITDAADYTMGMNEVLTVAAAQSVLVGDSDADGDALTAALETGPSNGTLTLNGDGTFIYTPNTDYEGIDSFTYRADDGIAQSAPQTVNVHVVDLSPDAITDAYSVLHDTVLSITDPTLGVMGNDSPGQGYLPWTDPAEFDVSAAGIAAINQPFSEAGTHNAKPYYQGVTDNGYYLKWDWSQWMFATSLGAGPMDAIYTHSDDEPTPPLTGWQVGPQGSGSAPTLQDIAPSGSALTLNLVDDVDHGALTLHADGTFDYTPDALFAGADSFTYTIGDGIDISDPGTVIIDVTNTAPIADDDSYDVGLNNTLSVTDPVAGLLTGDSDGDGDAITAVIDTAPGNGLVVLNADGTFDYAPNTDFVGIDTFTYRADDGITPSAPATVTVNVLDTVPIAINDYFETSRDTALNAPTSNGGILGNDDLGIAVMPGAGLFEITGTQSAEVDQQYAEAGMLNGKLYYQGVTNGNVYIEWTGDRWALTPNHDIPGGDNYFENTADTDRPPTSGWSSGALFTPFPMSISDLGPAGDLIVIGVVDSPAHGSVAMAYDGSFTFTPDAGYAGQDAFTYRIHDGFAWSNAASVDIFVRPEVAPIGIADNYTAIHDTVLNVTDPAFGVLANDTDEDGDALTATLIDAPSNGSVTLNSDGTFIYTPGSSYVGADSFTYEAHDGQFTSAVTTVNIDVTNVDPGAVDDAYNVVRNLAMNVNAPAAGLLANDVDADGDVLSAVLDDDAQHGTLTLNVDGTFTYAPDAAYVGTDSFTYHATDGLVDTGPATVTLTVQFNVPPTANADTFSVAHDQQLVTTDSILDNDSDADGDAISFLLNDDVANGVLLLNSDGTFTYTPDAGFAGNDSFAYHVTDGHFDSADVTATIHVTNQAPSSEDDAYLVTHDTVLDVTDPLQGVLRKAHDFEADALTATLDTDVQSGSLTLNGNGTFTYTPDAGFVGDDSFTFHISDGIDTSDPVTVTFSVVNDLPLMHERLYLATHDTVVHVDLTFGLLAGVDDDEGDNLTVQLVGDVANGSLQLNPDGSFDYTPAPAFVGADSFVYQIYDGTEISAPNQVTLEVLNVAPEAQDDAYTARTQDTLVVEAAWGVLSNDVDFDETDTLITTLITDVSNGTLALASDGSFTYTADTDFVGTDGFTYSISDGVESVEAQVVIEVENSAPFAGNDFYLVDHDTDLVVVQEDGLLANDLDFEDDPLTIVLVTNPANGGVAIAPDGSFTFTPNPGFVGSDSFTYHVSDGDAQSEDATVEIQVLNFAPIGVDDDYSVAHDTVLQTPVDNGVLLNDVDDEGESITAVLTAGAAHGALTFNTDGSFTYTPNAGYLGNDQFKYKISDGAELSDEVTVYLDVTNAAPLATDDIYTVPEDGIITATVSVLANDSDEDGDALTATLVTQPLYGVMTFNGDGTFDYSPESDFFGEDVFVYSVSDSFGDEVVGVGRITVTAVNDAPTGEGSSITVHVDDTYSFGGAGLLLDGDDVDGEALTTTVVTAPANGALVLNSDGTFDYTPNAGFLGADQFTYAFSDGSLASDPVTVTIDVTNAAPTATDARYFALTDAPLTMSVASGLRAYANDGDDSRFNLTVELVTGPASGSLSLEDDGAFTYTPDTAFTGIDTFTYRVFDGHAYSSAATTTLDVTDVPLVAGDVQYNITHDGVLDVESRFGLFQNDWHFNGDAYTATLVSGASSGTLVLDTQTGAFTYTPDPGFVGADSFSYTLSDGVNTSNIATVDIAVTNQAPDAGQIIAGFDTSYRVLHEQSLAADSLLAAVVDGDGDALTASLVTDVSNGTLTLDADGSFDYTPATGYVGADSFTFTAGDGTASTGAITVNIEVHNESPIALDDNLRTLHDTPLVGAVMLNDADFDNDALTAALLSSPTNGSLAFAPDGTFTYTPNAGFVGVDTFTYQIDDGADSAQGSVSIDILNNAPFVTGEEFFIAHGDSLGASVTANDIDIDNDVLTAALISGTSNGTLVFNTDGTFVYTPDITFAGADGFSYTVDDGTGAGDVIQTEIHVANLAPFAFVNYVETTVDTQLDIDVTATAADGDGDALTTIVVESPEYGSLAVNPDQTVTYTPDPGYVGEDVFTYAVSDGIEQSEAAPVVIDVAGINLLAVDDAFTTLHGQTLNATALEVLGNDDVSAVPTGQLTVSLDEDAGGGTLSLNTDGSFSYTPDIGFVGLDGFSYTLSYGSASATATVMIAVAPTTVTASDEAYTTIHDQALNTTTEDGLLKNAVAQVTGDVLSASLHTSPRYGTVSIQPDGSFVYTPDADYVGADSFMYELTNGYATDTGVVTLDVTNESPIAVDDVVSLAEDTLAQIETSFLLANDSDADGPLATIELVDAPAHGVLTFLDADTIEYAPTANYHGADAFTYIAIDEQGAQSAPSNVQITITSVEDPIAAGNFSVTVTEDTQLDLDLASNGNLHDPDGVIDPTTLSFTLDGQPSGQSASHQPASNFHGSSSLTYSVTDEYGATSGGTIDVTVLSANDPPLAADDSLTVAEDGSAMINVIANDTDPDGALAAQHIELVSDPQFGNVSLDQSGDATYVPQGDYHGSDSFTYRIYDDNWEASNTATVSITVTPVNDLPLVPDPVVHVIALTDLSRTDTLSIPISAGLFSDIDGDSLTISNISTAIDTNVGVVTGPSSVDPLPGNTWQHLWPIVTFTVSDGTDSVQGQAVVEHEMAPPPVVTSLAPNETGWNNDRSLRVINSSDKPVDINIGNEDISITATQGAGDYSFSIAHLDIDETWAGNVSFIGGSGTLMLQTPEQGNISNVTFAGAATLIAGGNINSVTADSVTIDAGGDVLSITADSVGDVAAGGDIGSITSQQGVGNLTIDGNFTGTLTANGGGIGQLLVGDQFAGTISATGHLTGITARRFASEASVTAASAGTIHASAYNVEGQFTATGAIDTISARNNIAATINAGVVNTLVADLDLAGTIQAGSLGVVSAGRDVVNNLTVTTGGIASLIAGRDVLGAVAAQTDIGIVSAGRKMAGISSTAGGINSVKAGENWLDNNTRAGIMTGDINAMLNIGLVEVFAAVHRDGDIEGKVTSQQGSIGTVRAAGNIANDIKGEAGVSLVHAGVTNGGNIDGDVISNAGSVSTVTSQGGSIFGLVSAGDAIGEVTADGDIFMAVTAANNIDLVRAKGGSIHSHVTSNDGAIGTVDAAVDVKGSVTAYGVIDKVLAGTNIVGPITSSHGNINTVTSGQNGGGSIQNDISAVNGNIGTVTALGTTAPDPTRTLAAGPSPGSDNIDPWLAPIAPTLEPLGVSGGDILGSINAGGSIDGVAAHGTLGATGKQVAAGTTIGAVWAAGDILSSVNAGAGALGVTTWGELTGDIQAPGDIKLDSAGSVRGNVNSTHGYSTVATWGDLVGQVTAKYESAVWAAGLAAAEAKMSALDGVRADVWGDFLSKIDTAGNVIGRIGGKFVDTFVTTPMNLMLIVLGKVLGDDPIPVGDSIYIGSRDDIERDYLAPGDIYLLTRGDYTGTLTAGNNISIAARGDVNLTTANFTPPAPSAPAPAKSVVVEANSLIGDVEADAVSVDVAVSTSANITTTTGATVRAGGGIGGTITAAQGVIDARALGAINGTLNAKFAVNVNSWNAVGASVTSTHSDVKIDAFGNVSGAVQAKGAATVNSYGAVSGTVDATEGMASILAVNGLSSAHIKAGGDIYVESWQAVTSPIHAGLGGEIGNVSLQAFGDITGAIQATHDLNISTTGDLTAAATTTGGAAQIEALGSVDADITAPNGVTISAGSLPTAITVNATAGGVDIGTLGGVTNLTVNAHDQVRVTAAQLIGNIDATSDHGAIDIFGGDAATLVNANAPNGAVTIAAQKQLAVNVTDSQSTFARAGADLTGHVKAVQDIDLFAAGNVAMTNAWTTNGFVSTLDVFAGENASGVFNSAGSLDLVAIKDVSSAALNATNRMNVVAMGNIINPTITLTEYTGTPDPHHYAQLYAGDNFTGGAVNAVYHVSITADNVLTTNIKSGTAIIAATDGTITAPITNTGHVTAFAKTDINAPIKAGFDAAGAKIAGSGANATVTAFGSILQPVDATNNIYLAAHGNVAKPVTADNFVEIIAASTTNDATVTANGGGTVFAMTDVNGNITAGDHLKVSAMNDIAGALTTTYGNLDVFAGHDITKPITAQAAVTVLAGNNVTHGITVGANAAISVMKDLSGAVDVDGPVGLLVLGDVSAPIAGDGGVGLTVGGTLTANVTSANEGVKVDALGAVTGSTVTAYNSAAVNAAGQITNVTLTSNNGSASLSSPVGISNSTVNFVGEAEVTSWHSLAGITVDGPGNVALTSAEAIDGATFDIGGRLDVTGLTDINNLHVVNAGLANITSNGDVTNLSIDNTGGNVDLLALGDLSTASINNTGALNMLVRGNASGITATSAQDVSLAALGAITGSTVNAAANVNLLADGASSVNVNADSAAVAVFGDLTTAADVTGLASIFADGNVLGSIDAGRADVIASGNIAANVQTTGAARLLALGDITSDTVWTGGALTASAAGSITPGGAAGAPVSVGGALSLSAADAITGDYDVAGNVDKIVTGGELNADVDADGDIGVLKSFAAIAGTFTAGGSIDQVWAVNDVTGSYTAVDVIGEVFSHADINAAITATSPTGAVGSVDAWNNIAGSISADGDIGSVTARAAVSADVELAGIDHLAVVTETAPFMAASASSEAFAGPSAGGGWGFEDVSASINLAKAMLAQLQDQLAQTSTALGAQLAALIANADAALVVALAETAQAKTELQTAVAGAAATVTGKAAEQNTKDNKDLVKYNNDLTNAVSDAQSRFEAANRRAVVGLARAQVDLVEAHNRIVSELAFERVAADQSLEEKQAKKTEKANAFSERMDMRQEEWDDQSYTAVGAMRQALEGQAGDTLEKIQNRLDLVGMVPVIGNVADIINGVISVVRGNYGDALLNFGAALPGIGLAVGGAKLAAKGAAATSRLGKVVNKTLDGVTGARTYLTASAKAAQAGQAGTAVIKSAKYVKGVAKAAGGKLAAAGKRVKGVFKRGCLCFLGENDLLTSQDGKVVYDRVLLAGMGDGQLIDLELLDETLNGNLQYLVMAGVVVAVAHHHAKRRKQQTSVLREVADENGEPLSPANAVESLGRRPYRLRDVAAVDGDVQLECDEPGPIVMPLSPSGAGSDAHRDNESHGVNPSTVTALPLNDKPPGRPGGREWGEEREERNGRVIDEHWRRLVARFQAAACFGGALLAIFIMFVMAQPKGYWDRAFDYTGSSRRVESSAGGGGAASPIQVFNFTGEPAQDQSYNRRKIKDVRPGQRLLALNPDLDDTRTSYQTQVDPERYRLITMRIDHALPDGSIDDVNIQTLQPAWWIVNNQVQIGSSAPVPLDLEELGVAGTATVLSIDDCPEIEEGPGAVVLTTVNHLSDGVYELTVEDEHGHSETLTPTRYQPFYSVEKEDWVTTQELKPGTRLRTHDGDVTVAGIAQLPGRHRVYNLTVETEHAYHVSGLGVVSHNNGEACSLNSKKSTATNHVYAIFNRVTGKIHKIGVSAKGTNAAEKSKRAQVQLKKIAEESGEKMSDLNSVIVEDNVAGRAKALLSEKKLVGMLRNLGQRLGFNKRPKGEFP